MRKLALLTGIGAVLLGSSACGNAGKSPEEVEAAKYPPVQQLSDEKAKEVRARFGGSEPLGARSHPQPGADAGPGYK